MARFGTWAPLAANWAAQSRMTQVDILSIHTMVGSLAGTDAMFRRNGFGGTFSHFGVGGRGECTQWQDTAYRAAANFNGNWHIISVECADVGAPFPAWNLADGSQVPAFTPEQCETLAQLIAAMCRAHNIPCQLIPDAKPGRRGIGYHRLGVPGFMVAGAEQWSTQNKKVCPGDRRIAQIPQIITRAQQILAGAPTGGFLMALSEAEQNEARDILRDLRFQLRGPSDKGWETFDGTGRHLSTLDIIRDIQHEIRAEFGGKTVVGRLMGLEQQIAGLTAAVNTLAGAAAGGDTVNADELRTVVREAMAEVVKVEVSIRDGNPATGPVS